MTPAELEKFLASWSRWPSGAPSATSPPCAAGWARTAMRYGRDGLAEVDIDNLLPGDRILIRQDEVLPVDGQVQHGSAMIDTSALTGEPLPRQMDQGSKVLSGTVSMGAPFDMLALRPASASAYAGIVRLVEAAHRARAPAARLADRWAMGFLALTVVLALTAWLWSGDPTRALAVSVVATPCPLILAVPVAIISGISRTARPGVLVKGGKALEALGRARRRPGQDQHADPGPGRVRWDRGGTWLRSR
ncbi:HAD-IC family P-type ATPase [Geminicoccus flavidas]|uniref:HAD-IC family P-type ATPase n=1 Tax=Geminicoccus flavidas TaxID=2506407 RepID=UPI00135C264F|nr:HAD-IC family P-type ATPase [Geminicoccus flavidas]